jgi:uncharacterized repeat protein (TIGR01451 family)
MKTGFVQKISRNTLMAFWTAVLVAMVLAAAPCALASTAENTEITNNVIVTYDDANNIAQTPVPASVTVTVALVPADPTISSPGEIDPSIENFGQTLSYTVTGNANGDDDYTISFTIVSSDVSDITVSDIPVTLGGTTLAEATDGTATITVPFDGNNDSSVNSIEGNDWIVIDGTAYQVAPTGIDESTGGSTNTATITLTAAPPASGAGSGAVGDVVGEQMEIDVTVTTGLLAGSATSGTHTVTATISNTADSVSADQTTPTVITVRFTSLDVQKYVRDIDNASGTPDYSVGGVGYYDSVSAAPGATLEYIIVVTNDTGEALEAKNVVIEDTIPQFTSYVPGTMRLDPDGTGFQDLSDSATDAGETDNAANPINASKIWIYAGSGGSDENVGANTGTGGTLADGVTTIGLFQVTID